jgi:hypothetical protein
MRMPLAARKLSQRRPTDRFFVGAQDAAEVLQLACGAYSAVLDVVVDGILDAVCGDRARAGLLLTP